MRNNALNSMRHRHCKSGDSQFIFILGKFLEVVGFQEARPISPSPHNPALTTPEVAAGSVTRKQLGAIVSGEGKALDKAEFKVYYNKSLSLWASVPYLPLLQMTAETKAPESLGSGLNLAVIIILLTSGEEPQSLQ